MQVTVNVSEARLSAATDVTATGVNGAATCTGCLTSPRGPR